MMLSDGTKDQVLPCKTAGFQLIEHTTNPVSRAPSKTQFTPVRKILFSATRTSVVPGSCSDARRISFSTDVTLIATDVSLIDSRFFLAECYFALAESFRAGFWANVVRNRFGGCLWPSAPRSSANFLPFPQI